MPRFNAAVRTVNIYIILNTCGRTGYMHAFFFKHDVGGYEKNNFN